MAGKYDAVWVSHSSMGDFLKCPRLYYLHNVYKSPETGRKMTIVSPAMSLGSAVHKTLEDLKTLPVEERLTRDLLASYEQDWETVASGRKGGFTDAAGEAAAKERGRAMVARVVKNPGPIGHKTVKLPPHKNDMIPHFYLDEPANLILCGVVDWLEYVEADDSIRIIDFKTGRNEEDGESLQLPIYLLLMNALQKRRVSGAAYWYLDKDDAPKEMPLPDPEVALEKVLKVAREVRAARTAKVYECPRGAEGCYGCRPYEAILRGEAEYVGIGGYGHDAYLLARA